MESNPPAEARQSKPSPHLRHVFAFARVATSILLLAALLYWESIDLHALSAIRNEPLMVVAAGVLIVSTLPIGALRWATMLRALDVALPLVSVFHIQCIAMFFSQLLFGPTSGDAIRGVYAWRMLRRGGGRIAISILVDRAFGLLALIILASLLTALRWNRVQEVPQLMLLALWLTASLAVGLAGGIVLFAAPELLSWLRFPFRHYPSAWRILGQVQDMFMAFRRRPAALAGVIGLSLLGQCMTLLAFVVIARSIHIGSLTSLDYMAAAPLALVANTLPFTPGGLGVGEAAFDQLCRWIEPVSSATPYATIFFAFRAVSTLTLLLGLVSFVIHRSDPGRVGEA
jgi:uncharacterized membrane protein YbhN (UPF0104 family)